MDEADADRSALPTLRRAPPALAWPKVNSRKKTANVDGAYTSSNTRGVPPARRHVDVVDAARTSSRR